MDQVEEDQVLRGPHRSEDTDPCLPDTLGSPCLPEILQSSHSAAEAGPLPCLFAAVFGEPQGVEVERGGL